MEKRARPSQLLVKHTVDRLAALVLLVVLAPVFVVVASAILFEDGWPVLYRQARLGRNGILYTMYKFRSMSVGCPQVLNSDGSTHVAAVDPRVTRVGQFIRRTSIDELPQLMNVLLGQMSLVGPRPDLAEHLAQYSETDRLKLRMKPGITGLPQVTGRNDLPWKERIRIDNWYIDNYSLWWDVKILFYTVQTVASGRGVTASGGQASDQREVS